MPNSAPSECTARFATEAEVQRWDELILANPGGGVVWSGEYYLRAKTLNRYRAHHLVVERTGLPSVAVAVIAKRVPLLGQWWSIVGGPVGEDADAVLEIAEAVATLARSRGAFFVQVEPQLPGADRQRMLDSGYRPSPARLPNVWTVRLDLARPEAEIFAGFAKKTRNAINKAGREGVRVERVPATDENCAQFYRLLSETAEGRFPLRPEAYFRSFWQSFAEAGQGQMFLAYRDGDEQLLAGGYALRFGDISYYKDGASLRVKRAYGVSHALQWEMIRWANEGGALIHDMCGTPPAERADDTQHPLYGVGRFKRSFKDEVYDFAGAFERPLRPTRYKVWQQLGEPIARRLSLAFWKDLYY